jgi:hypothetical protein
MSELGHLTDEKLTHFATFDTPLPETPNIINHLRTCPACSTRYRQLAGDYPFAPMCDDVVCLDPRI